MSRVGSRGDARQEEQAERGLRQLTKLRAEYAETRRAMEQSELYDMPEVVACREMRSQINKLRLEDKGSAGVVEAARRSKEAAEKRHLTAQSLVEIGEATSSEVKQAKADLAHAEEQLHQAKLQRLKADVQLPRLEDRYKAAVREANDAVIALYAPRRRRLATLLREACEINEELTRASEMASRVVPRRGAADSGLWLHCPSLGSAVIDWAQRFEDADAAASEEDAGDGEG